MTKSNNKTHRLRLARRLVLSRRRKQWTLEHLSSRSGVPVSSIFRAEKGSHDTLFPTVVRIAKALGLPLDHFA